MPPVEQCADVGRGAGEPIVCRYGEHNRAVAAQVAFRCHGHWGVDHGMGEFCKRVACARRDDEHIQQPLGADRFRGLNGVNDRPPGNRFQTCTYLRRRTKPGIHLGGIVR